MATQGTKKTVAPKTAATKALEAEATNTPVQVEFRGETLTLDPEALDDYELMAQLTRGMPMIALDVFAPDADVQERLLDTCEKSARGGPKLSSVIEMVTEMIALVGAGK